MFKHLKNEAQTFLKQYQDKDPATFAAAEEAIGGLLILDGFIGIDNPFGGKKRPGIFGALSGVVVGVIFMFIPTIFNHFTGVSDMTAHTQATVVSVHQDSSTNSNGSSSNSCSLVAKYTVNGTQYQNPSSFGSSSQCGLSAGSVIAIDYNPNKPGSWGYKTKSLESIIKIFAYAGILFVVLGLGTFIIRLFSIIFGWKLLRDGRNRAKALPNGTNLGSMIEQIRQEFKKTVFGSGGGLSGIISQKITSEPPTPTDGVTGSNPTS